MGRTDDVRFESGVVEMLGFDVVGGDGFFEHVGLVGLSDIVLWRLCVLCLL
jgi:hypothetical protein